MSFASDMREIQCKSRRADMNPCTVGPLDDQKFEEVMKMHQKLADFLTSASQPSEGGPPLATPTSKANGKANANANGNANGQAHAAARPVEEEKDEPGSPRLLEAASGGSPASKRKLRPAAKPMRKNSVLTPEPVVTTMSERDRRRSALFHADGDPRGRACCPCTSFGCSSALGWRRARRGWPRA